MTEAVRCEGAPRDLGRDQGAACRARLRARFARGPRIARWRQWLGLVDPEAREIDRDYWRYFPHQAEATRGMAAAAGVPAAWLVSELARLRADAVPVVVRQKSLHLARGLVGRSFVRHSRPEGLFASVDVALDGVLAPLIGVNERGLAAAVLPGRAERSGPPAWFAVRDCLERFESLEPALDWCHRGVGAPGGGLILADAGGACARVRFEGETAVERFDAPEWVDAPPSQRDALGAALAGTDTLEGLAGCVDGAAVDLADRALWVDGQRFGVSAG